MGPRPRRIVLLSVLLLASCQTGRREEYEPGWDQFHVARTRTQVEVAGRWREEKRSGNASPRTLSELSFREDLRMGFAGFYYHPMLVQFDGELMFGLEQRNLSYSDGDSRGVDGTNAAYDLSVDIFGEQPYSLGLFASRREVWTRQNFFPTNEALTEVRGFSIHAHDWWLPSKLTYRDYSFRGRGRNEYAEDSSSWRLEGERFGERGSIRYAAEIIDFQQRSVNEPVRSERFNATFRRWLDAEGLQEFRSYVSADRTTGQSETTRYLLDNTYDHQFTRRLRGNAYLRLRRSDRDGTGVDTIALGSGLRHQLFSSLSSGLSFGWGQTNYEAGSANTWSTNGSLSYRKNVPFGSVRASQSVSLRFQNSDALLDPVTVLAESHVFTSGVPLLLESTGIELNSVVVRDSNGLVVYTENVDYFLVQVGALVRIDIPISSLISPGDTILVDYDFQPSPAREIRGTTTQSSVGAAIGEDLDVSVTYRTTQTDVVRGIDTGGFDDVRQLTAVLQAFPHDGVVLGAEYENYDSSQSPFVRYRAFGSYSTPLSTVTDLASSADTYWLELPGAVTEQGSTARVGVNTRLASSATAGLSAEYHRVRLRQDQGDGYLLEAAYRRHFGPTSLRIAAQYAEEQFLVGVDQTVLRVEVVVTRTF